MSEYRDIAIRQLNLAGENFPKPTHPNYAVLTVIDHLCRAIVYAILSLRDK